MSKKFLLAGLFFLLIFSFVDAYTANVYEGWNLIPNGRMINNENNSDCLHNGKAKFEYSPLDNKYFGGLINASGLIGGELFPYNNYSNYFSSYYTPGNVGTSFWLYSTKKCIFEMDSDQPSPIVEMNLFKGWNFLTITKSMVGNSVKTLFSNCDVMSMVGWQATNQKWTIFSTNESSTAGGLIREYLVGSTVLFKVSSECKLQSETNEVIISPPVLPE